MAEAGTGIWTAVGQGVDALFNNIIEGVGNLVGGAVALTGNAVGTLTGGALGASSAAVSALGGDNRAPAIEPLSTAMEPQPVTLTSQQREQFSALVGDVADMPKLAVAMAGVHPMANLQPTPVAAATRQEEQGLQAPAYS